jgi:tetratricopeptide (TPR) repeat protein
MTRPARAAPFTLALVVLAAVLPYLNAFGHTFVRDDEVIIRDNAGLRSLPALREALLSNYWGEAAADAQWRPLALLSWALNYAAGGLETAGYTALDLAIHAGVCLVLLRLALSLGASTRAATAAALLFAVHPVHVEAVTGFVGRADTLATLFVLLALLWHRRAAGGSPAARALAALFLALGLLTKESAVAALLLIPALDGLAPAADAGGRPAGLRARLRRDYALYAVVAAAYFGARLAVLGTLGRDPDTILPAFNPLVPERLTPLGDLRGAGPAERLLTPFALVAEAARLLAWPAHLSMDYSFDQLPLAGSLFDGRVLLGLLVVALALAAVLRGRRRAPALAFAAAFALLAWLPTANLLFPIGTLFAERLLYLPSAGALLAVALLLDRCAARPGWRAPVVGLTAAALLALGARTWARNPAWRDTDAVTAAMVADAPASFLSHSARGSHRYWLSQHELSPPRAAALRTEARRHLETSLAICPESEQTNRAFVATCWDDRDPAATVPAYERLARLDPQDAHVQQGWAMALIELAKAGDEQARLAEAQAHLERALALDPREADALYARGMLRALDPQRRAEALADLQAVLRLRPDHPERAQIEAEIGRLQAPGG